jgi:hypothetical protein
MLPLSSSTAEAEERDMMTAKMKKKMVLMEAIVFVLWIGFDLMQMIFVSPTMPVSDSSPC